MAKFFRRIRQRLLGGNRYLVYAIGEIVLVVIGILIAIRINNWNENRKNAVKEVQYLQTYKTDLEVNRKELDALLHTSEGTYAAADSILKVAVRNPDNVDYGKVGLMLMRVTSYSVFPNQNGTVREILESGDLRIIGNDDIRMSIATWETFVDEIRSYEKPSMDSAHRTFQLTQKHIDLINIHYRSYSMDKQQIQALFADRAYINSVVERAYHSESVNEFYKKQLKRIEEYLNILEKELTQKAKKG